MLTENLNLSSTPNIQRNCGIDIQKWSTSVSETWCHQSKVERCMSKRILLQVSDFNLKGREWLGGVDSPGIKKTTAAAVHWLVFWGRIWHEIKYFGIFHAGVWYIWLEGWAVSLFCGKGTIHWPNHLILSPYPSQLPTRFVYMTILIVILDSYFCLQIFLLVFILFKTLYLQIAYS